MRRLSLAAFLAVSFFYLANPTPVRAFPCDCRGLGGGCICYRMFPHIFQEGPLFNYGPYYGYYPFKPYGPWDAYLRFDPFFYGDLTGGTGLGGNAFGKNANLAQLGSHFHKHGCSTCGFFHASWLHGGWFHGHTWLKGGYGHHHKSGCTACGGVAVAPAPRPQGEATARLSGFGDPTQSAVFYSATPTLDPALDLIPTAGQAK